MIWIYCTVAVLVVLTCGGAAAWLWLRKPHTRLNLLRRDVKNRAAALAQVDRLRQKVLEHIEALGQVAVSINKIHIRGGPLSADWQQIEDAFADSQAHLATAEHHLRCAESRFTDQGDKADLAGLADAGHRSLGEVEKLLKKLRTRLRAILESKAGIAAP